MAGNQNNSQRTFERVADNITNSGWVYVVTLPVVVLFIICLAFFVQDIKYSMWGYNQFPTSDPDSYMGLYVALFFSLLQMVAMYMGAAFKSDDNKENDKWIWLFAAIAVVAFVFDAGTDLFYLLRGGTDAFSVATALFDTFVVLWFASEVVITITFALMLVLIPALGKNFVGDQVG